MSRVRKEPIDSTIERRVTRAELAAKASQASLDSAASAAATGILLAQQTADSKQSAAPNDGSVYVQQNGAWIKLTAAVVAALPAT